MAPNLRLNAVAFVSPQNHPILIRTFIKQEEHAIKYHYIAHTSLDVIEERGKSPFGPIQVRPPDGSSNLWWKIRRLLPWTPLCIRRCCSLWLYHTAQNENHHRLCFNGYHHQRHGSQLGMPALVPLGSSTSNRHRFSRHCIWPIILQLPIPFSS